MLQSNNKISLIRFQSEVKLETAIVGDQLSKVKRLDEAGLIKALKNLIINLAESLNLTNTVNEAQIFEIALLVIENYYFLKIDELVLIFKNAKMGKYGKIYNRLDVQIVFEWIELYLNSEERIGYFEKENKVKKEPESVNMKKVYEEFRNRKEEVKPENKDDSYEKFKSDYLKEQILKEGK